MRNSSFFSPTVLRHYRAAVKMRGNFSCERLSRDYNSHVRTRSKTGRSLAHSLMDYITSETVTFELRSIIRNCAIKALCLPLSTRTRAVKDYTYMRGSDTTRSETSHPVSPRLVVLRPRISIKTSNFIFKFAVTAVAPIVHVPCHRFHSSSFWGLASSRHPHSRRLVPILDKVVR